jgi:RNA polymerase sigma factor (TIGR02999 family)
VRSIPTLAEALPPAYGRLRALARRLLERERPDHTLQPTALVHEAFLRLRRDRQVDRQESLLPAAAAAMRRVLVDHARARRSEKRGGFRKRVPLAGEEPRCGEPEIDLLALDAALVRLQELDPGLTRLVELRYFGGLSEEETAATLGVSARTVRRSWRTARLWLRRELGDGP